MYQNIRSWILFIFACVVYTPGLVSAADFSSNHTATYSIESDTKTHVTQEISIVNGVAEYYVSKYTLELGNQKISSVSAQEKNKALKTTLDQSATNSALTVEFTDKTVGKNATKNFKIQYDSDTILQKNGNIRTITIPKIAGNGINKYTTKILVPKSAGEITSIIPEPTENKTEGDKTLLLFAGGETTKTPITVTLGSEQYYTIGLSYHVKNPQNKSVYTEIALPMNTAFQTVVYDNISPKPQTIAVDEDGNYIARYTLLPRQELDIQFSGKVIVYKEPQTNYEPLSEAQRRLYTQKQKYWETDEFLIASLAAKLRTPKEINKYVIDTLSYDTHKLGSQDFIRQGALQALKNPKSSVCMEFTDLFIALARAAGIPAREVNGYAYTNDPVSRPVSLSQDILHAWPEYYDQERGWVQIDPTWQNTTHGVDYFNNFDLNHIAFVRKGMSSEYPYPAGSYKGGQSDTRDVLVSFADTRPLLLQDFKLDKQKTQTVFAGNEIKLTAHIKNVGNTPLESTVLSEVFIKDSKIPGTQKVVVPPFSNTDVIIYKANTSYHEDSIIKAEASVSGKSVEVVGKVVPWYKSPWTYLATLYGLGIPILCVVLYKSLHQKTMAKRNMV